MHLFFLFAINFFYIKKHVNKNRAFDLLHINRPGSSKRRNLKQKTEIKDKKQFFKKHVNAFVKR
jgi:hypothetical protein